MGRGGNALYSGQPVYSYADSRQLLEIKQLLSQKQIQLALDKHNLIDKPFVNDADLLTEEALFKQLAEAVAEELQELFSFFNVAVDNKTVIAQLHPLVKQRSLQSAAVLDNLSHCQYREVLALKQEIQRCLLEEDFLDKRFLRAREITVSPPEELTHNWWAVSELERKYYFRGYQHILRESSVELEQFLASRQLLPEHSMYFLRSNDTIHLRAGSSQVAYYTQGAKTNPIKRTACNKLLSELNITPVKQQFNLATADSVCQECYQKFQISPNHKLDNSDVIAFSQVKEDLFSNFIHANNIQTESSRLLSLVSEEELVTALRDYSVVKQLMFAVEPLCQDYLRHCSRKQINTYLTKYTEKELPTDYLKPVVSKRWLPLVAELLSKDFQGKDVQPVIEQFNALEIDYG